MRWRAAVAAVGRALVRWAGEPELKPAEADDDAVAGDYGVELSQEARRLVEDGRLRARGGLVDAPAPPPMGSAADRVRRSRAARW